MDYLSGFPFGWRTAEWTELGKALVISFFLEWIHSSIIKVKWIPSYEVRDLAV
jgi:hypothetical protein